MLRKKSFWIVAVIVVPLLALTYNPDIPIWFALLFWFLFYLVVVFVGRFVIRLIRRLTADLPD